MVRNGGWWCIGEGGRRGKWWPVVGVREEREKEERRRKTHCVEESRGEKEKGRKKGEGKKKRAGLIRSV